jgi:beta-phosphoglucomutase-like phosphatase (HAD superfamily)
VAAKKPAPDIYAYALKHLGVSPDEAIVVEDSNNGLRAARAAGLRTLVTVSSYTVDENFDGAALVVTSLGDPDGEPATVLRSPADVVPNGFVTLHDLSMLLRATNQEEES